MGISMNNYWTLIFVVILGNVTYHLSQKSIPNEISPFTSLIAAYLIALVILILAFPVVNEPLPKLDDFKHFNWGNWVLGLSIVMIELGYLLVYRKGWQISLTASYVNISVAVLLLIIGYLMFKERLNIYNIAGVILAVVSLILLSKKN